MHVYRTPSYGAGCTMGGSTRYSEIWVANDEECEDPAFRGEGFITREEAEKLGLPLFVVGRSGKVNHVRPLCDEGEPWFMASGNFAHTSDSRGPYHALKIHDRTEREGGECYAYYGAGEHPRMKLALPLHEAIKQVMNHSQFAGFMPPLEQQLKRAKVTHLGYSIDVSGGNGQAFQAAVQYIS